MSLRCHAVIQSYITLWQWLVLHMFSMLLSLHEYFFHQIFHGLSQVSIITFIINLFNTFRKISVISSNLFPIKTKTWHQNFRFSKARRSIRCRGRLRRRQCSWRPWNTRCEAPEAPRLGPWRHQVLPRHLQADFDFNIATTSTKHGKNWETWEI